MPRRLTLKKCQEVALKKNGKCLAEKYKNKETKMEWQCSKGHTWMATLGGIKHSESWCPECAGKKKLTIRECRDFAIKKNGKCLSKKYVGVHTKMKWRCEKKHTWMTSFSCLKNSKSWCPECAGKKKLTIRECRDFAIKKNGKCLSKKYVGVHTKMKWRCEKKHTWIARFGNIKKGQWCAECAGKKKHTIKICQDFALKKNGKCLSKKYTTVMEKMEWECSKGHTWMTSFNNIKNQKQWCPKCAGLKKHTIKFCQDFALKKNGKCLSKKYVNIDTKMVWECSKGHNWMTSFDCIKNSKSWCPYCSNGRSEELCREIFEKHFKKKFINTRPKFLHGLELDGYCKELDIAFEYNGEQHYKYIPHFHRNGIEDFKKQKQRDQRKYAICSLYDIHLILIPYHFNYQNPNELKIYIKDEISKLKLF